MKYYCFVLCLCLFQSCSNSQPTANISNQNPEKLTEDPSAPIETSTTSLHESSILNPSGNTIATRFSSPKGFTRIKSNETSFAHYLQNFSLKPHGTKVYLHNGQEKWSQRGCAAVIDIDTGTRDLQQCADAVMRLRGEYLFAQNRFDDISFNFTNGFPCEYSKWRAGHRVKVNGRQVKWQKTAAPSNAHSTFRKYMDMVFSYAGTLSLEKELKPVAFEDLKIGDVFIQGGSPGHAIIVVDAAMNKETGEKIFMLAQSYMPAQDIHVLRNPANSEDNPWYNANFEGELETPDWDFKKSDLKRF